LLNEFVRDNLDKPPLLQALGQIWLRMARRLREANIAHADLQHGNVLLVPGSKQTALAVKLIDYDGMWVPALAQKKSGEVGHPNYQHPQRSQEGTYDAEVDRFPLLVVATALRAVSVGGRSLWQRYDNGDNLLFRESDIKAPDNSPLFREVGAASDQLLRKLVARLKQACYERLQDAPLLGELISEEKPTAVQAKPSAPPALPTPAAGAWDFDSDPSRATGRSGGRVRRKPRPRRGVPGWLVGIGLLAVLGGGGFAGFLMMRPNTDTGPGPIAQASSHPTAPVTSVPPPHTSAPPPPPTSGPPATRPTPPETHVDPPETRIVPPETRPVPPETRPVPPETRPAPPDTKKLNPPPRFAAVGSLFRMLGQSKDLLAVSMEKESTWQLYDSAEGRIVRRFGEDRPSKIVAFHATPDGSRAVTADEGQQITLWDPTTGKSLHVISDVRRRPTLVTLSADGTRLAWSEGRDKVDFWDLTNTKALDPIPVEGNLSAIALSPDGQLLAWAQVAEGAAKQPIQLVETGTGKIRRTLPGHARPVITLEFSPDGQRLASAGLDNVVRFWKLNGQEGNVGPFHTVVTGFVFSPDGSKVIACASHEAIAFGLSSHKVLATMRKSPEMHIACAFTNAASKVAVTVAEKDQPLRREEVPLEADTTEVTPPIPVAVGKPLFHMLGSTAKFVARSNPDPVKWDLLDLGGGRGNKLAGHKSGVTCVSATADSKLAITGSEDRSARVWETSTGACTAELKGHTRALVAVALSADGKHALTAPEGGPAILWDVTRETEVRRLGNFFDFPLSGTAMAFSDDGKRLAIGFHWHREPVKWSLYIENTDGTKGLNWQDIPGPLLCVAFSQDGSKVAGLSEDGSLTLRDGEMNQPTQKLPVAGKPRQMQFSPDGKKLLVVAEEGVLVWSVSGRKKLLAVPSDTQVTAVFTDGGSKLLRVRGVAEGVVDTNKVNIPEDRPVVVAPPVRPPRRRPERQAAPSKEELAAAEKEVREQFKDLYKTKSPKLTQELSMYALGRGDQSAANRYAALKELRTVRGQDGDIGGVLFYATEMSRRYEVDSLQTRTDAIEAAVPFVKASQVQFHLSELLHLIAEARGEERGDLAGRLVKAVALIAAKGTLAHRAQVAVVAGEVKEEQAATKRVHDAITKLEKEPDNAEAHLIVGQFRCRQEHWGEGVRHLAKTADVGLKTLAEKDMADPTDMAGRKALGAAWDGQARKESTKAMQTACCLRSMFWYRQALVAGGPLADFAAIQSELKGIERRVPDHADPWRDLDVSSIPDTDRKKDVLHIDRNKQVSTRVWYKGGIDVTVVARTGKTNIRLVAGQGGMLIFNWEGTDGGFRVHRPDSTFDDGNRRIPGSMLPGKPDVLLKANQWYTLRWQLTPAGQKVWVDNEVVFEIAEEYDLSAARPVSVLSTDSPIEVKFVAIRDLGDGDAPSK
jgi:WD40 repeat protein